MTEETKRKSEKISAEILQIAKNKLLVNLRFLDVALSRLSPVPDTLSETESGEYRVKSCATDGRVFIYSPRHIITTFKLEEDMTTRAYLHVVFHCVFKHMFVSSLVNTDLWDIACDIAVESAINDLGLDYLGTLRAGQQKQFIEGYKDELKMLSAEKIYRFLLDKQLPQKSIDTLKMLFKADEHFLWYLTDEQKRAMKIPGYGDEDSAAFLVELSELAADWGEIGGTMLVDLETFGKQRGTEAGLLTQNLREVNRERYNYTEFLKKFAVRGEVMRINPDEFDYNYYTYGLTLYENLPLIEPLEYKDTKAIRDFVIAIDTSGSTSGELVQKFVQKTFNILKSSESFFTKINLHIIQCDAAIQEDVKITTQEEFDAYLRTMKIHGLGGTDFRPVFSYVNSLVEIGEFTNLKGLIYLTDGYGEFPAKKPVYETAFVFIDDEPNNYNVPPWAIKLVLRSEEI
ncbi:MAG: metallopeptidase [Oscillospiraceae bacterium]|nr:metallopeptidase [Oscillospiraceae bacterium]